VNRLIDAIRARLDASDTWVIGVGGAVAVGKTTVAQALAVALEARVVSTDGFLYSNDELARREILMRKGFPESYDVRAIVDAFTRLRGGESITVPVYSHETYDIVDRTETVDAGRIIVEGVVALQDPIRGFLDVAVYVDAEAEDVRGWFVDRFVQWCREARPGTFYAGFAGVDAPNVRSVAEMTWDGINRPNLDRYIAPSKDRADIVIRKDAGHRIVEVTTV
jgi:type I pantothenate kinase